MQEREMWRVRERERNPRVNNHWRPDQRPFQRTHEARKDGAKGMSREDIYRNIELSSHTVSVDNLPQSMSIAWLWQLCNHEGRVVDVSMPRKKRTSNPLPFAFVHFSNKQEALKAIQNLQGIQIRGCTLVLKEAKYSKFAGGQRTRNLNNAGNNGGGPER